MSFVNGTYITKNDINTLHDGIKFNGVISGVEVTESSPAAMTVDVASGVAIFAGVYTTITGATKTIDTAHSEYPRKDIITINSSSTITVTEGVARQTNPLGSSEEDAISPTAENIPSGEFLLAEVWVPAKAIAIGTGYITDKRVLIPQLYIRSNELFLDIRAALATYVRTGEDLSAAIPITFTIDAQPDIPRTITWAFTSYTQITAYILVIVGVDARGKSQTVTMTEADGWSGETNIAFATITSIKLTARTGTGVGNTMNVGIGSKVGLANAILASGNIYKVNKNHLDLVSSSYTVNATYSAIDLSTGGAITDNDDFNIWYKSIPVVV